MKTATLTALTLSLATISLVGCNDHPLKDAEMGHWDTGDGFDTDGETEGDTQDSDSADGGSEDDGGRQDAGFDGHEGGNDDGGNDDGGSDDGAEDTGAPVCEPVETELFAGQHIDAGLVAVYTTADSLVIEIEADATWMIQAAHIFAGTTEVPQAPGQFPHIREYLAPGVEFHVTAIPLSELDIGCGDTLNIAVHTELVRYEDGQPVQEETGWAYGDEEFEKSWGWHFDYQVCCSSVTPQ